MYSEVLIKLQDMYVHGTRVLMYNVLDRDSKPKRSLDGMNGNEDTRPSGGNQSYPSHVYQPAPQSNRIPTTETVTVYHRVPDELSAYVIWGRWDPVPGSERGALSAFGVNRKGRYSREAIGANK